MLIIGYIVITLVCFKRSLKTFLYGKNLKFGFKMVTFPLVSMYSILPVSFAYWPSVLMYSSSSELESSYYFCLLLLYYFKTERSYDSSLVGFFDSITELPPSSRANMAFSSIFFYFLSSFMFTSSEN
jgi:hypothetical protein